ncbi:MAG TPA: prenyltransferase [Micromonosporaceae bacterium]
MTESARPIDRGCVLTAEAVAQTADYIASVQTGTGQIPWFPGGHTDPWDHIEAAMALDVAGRGDEARTAYEWLRRTQNPDGSWYRGYHGDRVVDDVRESNFTAYLAVGVWHHYLSTGDESFLDQMWPAVCAAMEFVLALQAPGGQIGWARAADGSPTDEALLTGCASMFHALRCALAMAEHRGVAQPDWELAAAGLGHAVAAHTDRFSPRQRYSMDWYYPVLGSALRGPAAHDRINEGWPRFVVPGLGVRCVSDRPWVTVAETAELVLSLCAVGEYEKASVLLAEVQHLRCPDGGYWTGYVYPDDAVWPEERTTWTAGAVVLASAVLAGEGASAAVFGAVALPEVPMMAVCHPDTCPA